MKFQGYYNNSELFLKIDEHYYNFPNGIVGSVNDVTYLAINISHFNSSDFYIFFKKIQKIKKAFQIQLLRC